MPDTQWIISTVAGTGEQGYAGDGGPATQALLNNPFDLAFDPAGNLCFSDTYNHCIRRIDARTGVITTIAGTGESGFRRRWRSGDTGADESAVRHRHRPRRQHLRRRSAERARAADRWRDGVITTLAGDGSGKFSGDGGPSDRAGLAEPNGLALDREHRRLFIADVADHRVRVIDLASGAITTFAGTGDGASRRRRRPGDVGRRVRRARGRVGAR